MKVGIIGNGEIGSSLAKVYRAKNTEPMIRDLTTDNISGKVDILDICIPGGVKDFVKIVNGYIYEYEPQLTIIHSTVPVGTTKKIIGNVVHSPVRGIHPNLQEGIETFVKFVGYNNDTDYKLAKKLYDSLGIETRGVKDTNATELAKLLSTTYYGLCISFHGEMKKMCDEYDIDFDVINDWTDTYNKGYTELNMKNVVRPNLYPPKDNKIGGHCVIPNVELLLNQFSSTALDLIVEYKDDK